MSVTWEVDCAVVVRVNLVDHILKLRFAWVLAQGPHDGAQLLGRDLACQQPKASASGLLLIIDQSMMATAP